MLSSKPVPPMPAMIGCPNVIEEVDVATAGTVTLRLDRIGPDLDLGERSVFNTASMGPRFGAINRRIVESIDARVDVDDVGSVGCEHIDAADRAGSGLRAVIGKVTCPACRRRELEKDQAAATR